MEDRLDEALGTRLRLIGEAAAEVGATAYLVGGPVRDLLLGRRSPDLDIAVEGPIDAAAEIIARRLDGRVRKTTEFMTCALALADGGELDIAHARTERYPQPGALPVVEADGIADDLRRRDFTVNAIALALAPGAFGRLLDPHGGMADLDAGLLRVLHERSFDDDPTRMIRAVRFMLRLGFALEPETSRLLRRAVEERRLATVSGARVRNELRRLFDEAPAEALGALQRLGLIEAMGLAPASEKTARACVALPAAVAALRLVSSEAHALAACLGIYAAQSDVDPGALAERLILDASERRDVVAAATLIAEPHAALTEDRPDSELHRALRGISATVAAAAWTALDAASRARLERYWGEVRHLRADVTGEDLIAAGYEPGPTFAQALEAALTAKLDRGADRNEQLEAALRALRGASRDETT